jgi:hypothetical protein
MNAEQKRELVQAQAKTLEYLRSISAPIEVILAASAVQIALAKKEPELPFFVDRK